LEKKLDLPQGTLDLLVLKALAHARMFFNNPASARIA
jgi:hypothetical protein